MPPSIRASKKLSYQKLVYLSVYLSVYPASSAMLCYASQKKKKNLLNPPPTLMDMEQND